MISSIQNFFKLIRIFRERGNFPFIRKSREQLKDFILCRSGMNKKSILKIIPYWFFMLKSLDVLVWRLETFGFLHLPHASESDIKRLNQYI
jgi:hypothetical protein